MNRELIDSLEDCLRLLEAGIPLEECLGDCLEFRAEIRELLLTAQAVGKLRIDQVPVEPMDNARLKLLAQALGMTA